MITMDDKYRFEDFGLYVEEGHEHPATPEIERKTMHIPGRAGQWDFGSEIKAKPLDFPLATSGFNREDLQQKLDAFVAFLFDEFGQSREIKIVYDYAPDKFYIAKVREGFSPERVRPFSRFLFPLVANDPYKYSNKEHEEQSSFSTHDIRWGSTEVTFADNYLFGATYFDGSTAIEVEVTEGLAVQPIFEIEGTAGELKISSGKYSFTLPSFEDAKWIVDFNKYIAYKDGSEQMIDDMRHFYLLPGNNKIKITGSDLDVTIAIRHRNKFM